MIYVRNSSRWIMVEKANVTLFKMDADASQPGILTRQCAAEHLGLGYIASSLDGAGHDVKLLYQDTTPLKFAQKIVDTRPDILGATSMTYTHQITRDILGMVKSELPYVKTIIGGDHISGYPKSIDDVAIDYGVIGEGEDTVVELVDAIRNGRDTSNIAGIAYFDNGVKLTEPRKKRNNLDDLAFPYRSDEIMNNTRLYSTMNIPMSKIKSLGAIVASRGCPFNCGQCGSKNTLGTKTRWRSAKNIADEMEGMRDKYGTNAIIFYDLTFNLRKDKVLELSKEIVSRGIQKDISWYTLVRVADNKGVPLLDKEMLEAMHDAGCRKLGYGIETFDEGLKNNYNKSLSTNVLEDVLRTSDEAGILNRGFLMIGPNETKDSLEMARRMLRKIPLHEIRISSLTPFPGTPFYDKCKEEGSILTEDFAKYSSDEMILRPDNFTVAETNNLKSELFNDFMNSPEYQTRIREKVERNPEFKEGFKEYFDILRERSILNWEL